MRKRGERRNKEEGERKNYKEAGKREEGRRKVEESEGSGRRTET